MRRILLVCVPVWLFWCAHAAAQDIDSLILARDAELRKLRAEIAEERKKISELEKREKDAAQLLAKLEKEEKLVKKLLMSLGEKEAMLEKQVTRLREDLKTSEAIYRSRLNALSRRLRQLYKESSQASWQRLLGARSFDDLVNRYRYLSVIAEQDARLVEEIRQRKSSIEKSEADITEKLSQVSSARREKEQEFSNLKENERKRQRSLADLRSSKSKSQKRLEELAQAERDILSILEDLERRRAAVTPAEEAAYAEKDFPALRGRMVPPVVGRVVRNFGPSKHPELGTITNNKGVDIEAPGNSTVRAVARGKVEFAGLLPGIGNCIIIAHGAGYYTLYAHASRILVRAGQTVSGGDKIAELGVPGEETRELHFEIRKAQTPLDPAEWLRK